MSRYFVDDPPVPVYEFNPDETISDQPPNIIWIRGRMDMKVSGKVKSELIGFGADGKTVEMRPGQNETALLIHNILRWEGPDLGMIPCTPENIQKLNPSEPHIRLVLEEIAERNKVTPSPKAGPGAISTSMSAGASDMTLTMQAATPSGNGIPRSRLQQHLDGHLKK